MDVHRSRFVPYPTSDITALAFSRASDSGYAPNTLPALKLALGRADGSVEIWNPQRGAWVQEAVLRGEGERESIAALAWTQDPDERDVEGHLLMGQQRLFSIAAAPEVLEWDLARGVPGKRSSGNFSQVWCFAAQPRARGVGGEETAAAAAAAAAGYQDIVAGCGDGTMVLLTTVDGDLQFKRLLARVGGKKASCMCVAYQKPEIVVAGFADSAIRIFDTRSATLVRSMSIGVGIPGAPTTPIVWQVKCLPNGDIVSGDSNGEVRFWDGRLYALMQKVKGPEGDCVDLVTSTDGKTVVTGNLNGKMAVFKQTTGSKKSWGKTSNRRIHESEVKGMAVFDSKGMSVFVSGGSGAAPLVVPLGEYGKENMRWLPSLPQEPPLASAPKARLLASWWENNVYIWRIARQNEAGDDVENLQKPHKLVSRLALTAGSSIRTASISADGKVLAAATNTEVKVFQLRKKLDADTLAVRKLDLPKDYAELGARSLLFSPDGRWLAAATSDSEVHLARLAADSDHPKQIRVLHKTVELERLARKSKYPTAYKKYEHSISRLAFASDSSVLVASDLAGHLDSWVLQGHEDLTAAACDVTKETSHKGSSRGRSDSDSESDSDDDDDAVVIFYGQHWSDNPAGHLLPKLDSAPVVLTFRPAPTATNNVNGNPGVHATRHNPHAHSHSLPLGQHRLWVMTARQQMYEFDVLAGRLSDWSRRNPTEALPKDFTKIMDRTVGAVWDVTAARERLWLYGHSWVFMLNVSGDLTASPLSKTSRKRRRRGKDGAAVSMDEDESSAIQKRLKSESGAGGKVRDRFRNVVGAQTHLRRFEDGEWDVLDLEEREREGLEEGNADDDDEDDDVGLRLTRPDVDGQDSALVTALDDAGGMAEGDRRRWWCTFNYRPILGMVVLEGEQESGALMQNDVGVHADEERPLEVVIVERPAWDVKKGKEKAGA